MHGICCVNLPHSATARFRKVSLQLPHISDFSLIKRVFRGAQKLGKELKSQDELGVMDGGKCILQLRGVRPFFSDKYDITRHKNYSLLLDDNPKNEFDIEKFVRRKAIKKAQITQKTILQQYSCNVQGD